MTDYEKLYYALFNDVTRIIRELEHAIGRLARAQVDAEWRYLEADAENVTCGRGGEK